MTEKAMEIRSEGIKHRLVSDHRTINLLGKSFGILKNFAVYKLYKKQNYMKAEHFWMYRKTNVCFSMIKFYSEHRRMKKSKY